MFVSSRPESRPNSSSPDSSLITRKAAALTAVLMAPSLAPLARADLADADMGSGEATRLDRVTVTDSRGKLLASPKFTEPLRDTPQTIVVVPKAVIEQQGATNLSDVLRNTPGITFAAGEGGNVAAGDSFFMRGFDTSGNIFIDGVRDTGAYTRDVFNLEQVEIAKGPAGADNGRGGASGYVNLASKTPHLETLRNVSVLYGTGDLKRATIDLSQLIDEASVKGTALRVAAMWQDGGVPGRNEVENSSWGVAPSLALGLGTPTRFTLAASYLKQDNLPDSGLPIVAVPGGADLPADVPALTSSVSQKNFYGLADADFDHITAKGLTARIEHDFNSDLKFSNQTRLASNDRDALNTYIQNSTTTPTTFAPTTVPLNPATGAVPPAYTSFAPATATVTPRRLRTQQENEIISNQTNVTALFSTGMLAHTLSSGAEFTRETQFNPTWQPVAGPSTNLYAPDPHRSVTVEQIPYRPGNLPSADARTDTVTGYAFDTIKLHPKLLFNGSVRLEHYETRYLSLPAATVAAPAPTETRVDADGNLLSWKTGFVFKPRTNGSVYIAYGNAFTPPGSGFTLSATASNQNNPNLDPQETRNFEIGTKWDFFKNRLSTSLALYHSRNLNGVSTDAVTGLVTQDISQTVKGVEVGVSGKITDAWLVFGGFGYIDSEYEAAGTTSAANDGASLRFTPRLSGSLWTTYILPFRLTIGGGVQYSDSVLRNTSNSTTSTSPTLSSVPSYWVFNLMADYAFTKNFSLRLNLNNVTDEDYIRLNNNGGRYYPGPARSFVLAANLKL